MRIKGGDNLVLGRGEEEEIKIVEYNVKFRIVKGVKEGVGGIEYEGIEEKNRDINKEVKFMKGNEEKGEMKDGVDWEGIER